MKLFVYDHCPYCVRARMIFGLKDIPFELIMLANDDEATPIKMVGQKMVPILQKEEGSFMPESLDIVNYIDNNYGNTVLVGARSQQIADIMAELAKKDYLLVYPRFVEIGLEEFKAASARKYFMDKRVAKTGSFDSCLQRTDILVKDIESALAKLETALQSTSACNGELSLDDICLFPVLRNLTCVKSLQFPSKVKAYIESMAKISKVDLYFDKAM